MSSSKPSGAFPMIDVSDIRMQVALNRELDNVKNIALIINKVVKTIFNRLNPLKMGQSPGPLQDEIMLVQEQYNEYVEAISSQTAACFRQAASPGQLQMRPEQLLTDSFHGVHGVLFYMLCLREFLDWAAAPAAPIDSAVLRAEFKFQRTRWTFAKCWLEQALHGERGPRSGSYQFAHAAIVAKTSFQRGKYRKAKIDLTNTKLHLPTPGPAGNDQSRVQGQGQSQSHGYGKVQDQVHSRVQGQGPAPTKQ